MKKLKLNFEHGNIGVMKEELINRNDVDINIRNNFLNFKVNNNGLIYMDGFIETLKDNNWVILEKIINVDNIVYIFYSKQYNIKLDISFTKNPRYLHGEYNDHYEKAKKVLDSMSVNAKVTSNNVNEIQDYQTVLNINNVYKKQEPNNNDYEPNLRLIKGTKHNPSIKKLLKTKKGKIALCTIIGFTIVAGSFIAHTITVRAEAQEVINNNSQYSYQNDQSSDTINQQRQLYQAIQNGEVDTSLANPNEYIEEMKTEYNEQNYQNVR